MSRQGRERFGLLVERTRQQRGRSLPWVAAMLSDPPHGAIWTAGGVGQLQQGKRIITKELADRLIAVLDMDADEAYEALGWWPPGLTRKDLAAFRARRKADLEWKASGQPERRRYERRHPNGAPDLPGPGLSEAS